MIPFPTSSGIRTTGEAQAPAAPAPAVFDIETIDRSKPILFSRDEAWSAISSVQEAREIVGQTLDLLAQATVSNREQQYKSLLQQYGQIKGLLESAFAYTQLCHEAIFRVLSNANVANGITRRVEVTETVTPSQ